MGERYTLKFPWPDKALHSNSRAHWAEKARKTKGAKTAACWIAKEAKVPTIPNAVILVEGWPPTLRGDVHNLPIACKAIIDGIALAMGCDDKGFHVDWPVVWAGTKKGGEVVMHVLPPINATQTEKETDMSETKRVTLDELRAMKERGEINPPASTEPSGESLPDGFWDDAAQTEKESDK